jgi:negative regulator of genetic competence, sporulation and motility
MLRQFEFTLNIEAEDIFKAQKKAKEFFGEKMYEEKISWVQVFKRKEPVSIIIPPRKGAEL